MAKKKKDTGYKAALFGARGILKTLIYICGLVIILYLGKTTYTFGYDVFNQKPVAESEAKGQDVTVVVKDGTSTYGIGKLLYEKGLITGGPRVFWVQVRTSDYYGKLEKGTYILNTHQTVDDMLKILSKEETKGQPSEEDEGEEGGSEEDAASVPPTEEEGTQEGGE
ncbi:hypothetical protein INP51_02275 [Blautia liquoris]|jgi:UPF0755 protein|uniref:YceG-like family protein n=1 Tax=Blautia liquoris TaxID=2779518 RepID=A0A7M2RHK8_9FIRM|nr:hypothetical protein [Blautia liquoris]QOV19823.1 hypothetical protein INP51_02275 [Blautia liquoris]